MPPLIFELTDPVALPLQSTSTTVKLLDIIAGSLMLTLSVIMHPFTSVIVTS